MATGLIGALRITLGIDASDFEAGTSKARAEMRGFQRDFARMGKKWQNMGRDFSQWVTLPILAAGAGVLKMAGDFESAMIKVGISTEATADQMNTMRQMAKDLGAETIFSAKEAAEGMDQLAKAGIKTTDIIDGAAAATVNLAAAAGSELEPAAAIISDAMNQFNLKSTNLPDIVNAITGAVNESKMSFEDFVLAAGQAGGVAGSAGISFKEFAAGLAGTSSMFASGSDAGTSFKTFLQRLVPDTKKARLAMEEAGFSAYDAAGQMKPLRDIAEQLQTQFGHMSEEERAGHFKAMFGQDAIRTAIGLMKLGGEGFDEVMAKINNTNAADQAAKRMEGFNAQMEQFRGALENLAIAIGESGFLESMTGLIEKITEWLNWMSKANPEMLKWGTIIAGVAASFGPLMLIFGTFIKAVGMGLPLLMKLGPLFTGIAGVLKLVAVAAGIVVRTLIMGLLAHPVLAGAALLITGVYLAWKHWDKIVPIVQNMANGVSKWLDSLSGGAITRIKKNVHDVAETFRWMYDVVVGHSYVPDMVDEIGEHMARLKGNMVEPVKKDTESVAQAFQQLQQEVSGLLDRLFPQEARYQQFLAELMILEKGMRKMGFTADETAAAIRKLRDEYAQDRFGEDGPPAWIDDYDPERMETSFPETMIPDADKVLDEIKDSTKDKTAEMAKAWAGMARDAISSMKGMVQAFKSGDILGGIEKLLDIVVQVISAIQGIRGGAPATYNRGGGSSSPAIGFANGGDFTVGGSGGVDSQLVRFRATPGEKVRITKGERENQGGVVVYVKKGEMFDAHVERVAVPIGHQAAARGAMGGASMAARVQRRQRKGALA